MTVLKLSWNLSYVAGWLLGLCNCLSTHWGIFLLVLDCEWLSLLDAAYSDHTAHGSLVIIWVIVSQCRQLNMKTWAAGSAFKWRLSREMVYTYETQVFSKSLIMSVYYSVQPALLPSSRNRPFSFGALWSAHSNMVLGETDLLSLAIEVVQE